MSQDSVVAVYDSLLSAEVGVLALNDAKFPYDQVSIVSHDSHKEALYSQGDIRNQGDQSERNAAKGAGLGGLVGALLTAPLLTVSGVGAVLVVGPIALGAAGAIVGGLLGAMSGWGVHADHIREYEEKISNGAVLIIVNGDPQQVAEAKGILQRSQPAELHLHGENSEDMVEP